MKRIANAVAVQTVLYATSPKVKIKIVDYDNSYDLSQKQNGKEKFFGKAGELIGAYQFSRETEAEVQHVGLEVIDGEPVLVFSVITKFEQYK